MNIGILSGFDHSINDYALIALKNKVEYCTKHKYTFINHVGTIETKRHPSWNKINICKRNLQYFDWIFWIDADAIFTNFETKIEDVLQPYANGYDVVTAFDGVLNTGLFFLRNCDFVYHLLEKIYENKDVRKEDVWYEQASMIYLYNNKLVDISRIAMSKQHEFNSYGTTWKAGDYILHIAGVPFEDKVRVMREYEEGVLTLLNNKKK